MIKASEQRGFLAEISRQGNNLDVERDCGQRFCDVGRVVAAAVIDIHDFNTQATPGLQIARDLGNPLVQAGQTFRLIEQRHHHRQRRFGRRRSRA